MKNLYKLLVLILLSTSAMAQTSGGPDAYGYEWRNSNNASGPTYNWVDITSVGTMATGLNDDNSIGMIDMNMDFHYYWSDYDQVKIGSNGWLSFNNVGNIAHCFPNIPTAGGSGDNILAPFMSDLFFDGTSSGQGQVYYHTDVANERFIVSYIDVPWWSQNSPGYVGSNTFQVILSAQDSSITFQYQSTTPGAFLDQTTCATDLVLGMENITGNLGLLVSAEIVPAANLAVKFYYPQVVTFQVPDATPSWVQNIGNLANIEIANTQSTISTEISNVGNTDITTDVTVRLTIQDTILTTVYTYDSIISNLLVGANQQLDFDIPGLIEMRYYATVEVINSADINPSNNSVITELVIIDNTSAPVVMSYATQNVPNGSLAFSGSTADGGGIHIVPSNYPVTLESVDMFILTANMSTIPEEYTVEIMADDAPNGFPGTVLATEVMAEASYTSNNWVNTPLTNPLVISSGGIYVVWTTVDSVALGTENAGPISRRTFEFVGGSWGNYRESTTTDLLINANFAAFTISGAGVDELGALDNVNIVPNPSKGLFIIDASESELEVNYTICNSFGQIIRSDSIAPGESSQVDLVNEAKGIYFIKMRNDKAIKTERVVVQ